MMNNCFDPNISIVLDNMISEWNDAAFAELSVILVHLKFLSSIHQTHHWITKGDHYYSDHLLFQRFYETVQDEIDSVAEKTIGLGGVENVNINLQTKQLLRLVNGYGLISTIPQTTEYAKRSLKAELNFIQTCELALKLMEERCTMTKGVDNLISGILDTHESHVYLLKQRISP